MRITLLRSLTVAGLLLCAPAAFAQTTPRFSTPPNTTGANSFPFNSTTNKIQLQYERGEFGVTAPHIISRVYVQRSSAAAAGSFTNLTIWMGQSSTWPTATNAWFTPMTQVYFAATTPIPAGAADDWVGWQLDTPFFFDPADHLIVIFCQEGYTNGFSVRNVTVPTGPRRIWASGGCAAVTPVGSGAQLYNFGFDAMPAAGLHANFDADVKAGAAPLRVQFSDQTYSSDPGGVTSWAWDLTGDTRVDSTIQNPIWTYPTQNRTVSYDVTLTVTDASHPQSILTKRNFITVDPPPVADFDANPRGGALRPGGPPLIVRFSDLSIGATAWSWDLTGDTRIESTAQNPVYPYIRGGNYSITLAVTGVGGNDRITKTDFIQVTDTPELSTLFAGGNGGSSGWVNLFDIDVKAPSGIWITAFDVNCSTYNVPVTLDVYVAPTTYIGKELNPGAWTKVSTGSGTTAAAANLPTPVDVGDFFLGPGQHGIAILYTGSGMSYTNGTGIGPGGNQFYQNADLEITLGASVAGLFSGSLFTPRVWNGTLYYVTPGWPKFGPYGEGCRGSNGVPVLAPAMGSIPRIGTTFTINLSSMPAAGGSALALIGLSKTAFGPVPLPFDLAPLGAPGCRLLTSISASIGVANVGGLGSLGLPIPNDPVLVGGYLTTQALVIDPTANTMGLTVTNAGEMHLGN